ncbi:MAG TPA: circadian clock protein KaiC [Chthoniobacteraceae bacterium]|nr:circadian clock protein KaiC [Chthoniobacteraceae bacterium]
MALKTKSRAPAAPQLPKAPTGISGFDEITNGGLPAGRPTLVCGSAGCGKSLFATEFLVRGILQYGEPGVLVTFEEGAGDIRKNVASLGFDIAGLERGKKLMIDHVRVDRNDIDENGEYDLEGLFVRIGYAIDTVKARRVVLDTVEALFSGFSNEAILRAELRRLFGWLKDRGMTTVITAERGDGTLTRQGLEEYVSDCVILLDHRVHGQISTRRLRIVKYRGSTHGTNEYPFLIDEHGFAVLPITGSGMDYAVSSQRIPSGIPELDEMLGGGGFYRGSTVMLSGTAGTGKTSMAAHLAEATCKRGRRCLFFPFEESAAQVLRNMRSIGIRLQPYIDSGLLQFHSTRPTVHGVEMHLVRMHKLIEEFKPEVVIVDPVTNIRSAGTLEDSTNMIIRLIDYLRKSNILGFLISLTSGASALEATEEGISSMVDTWLLLRDVEASGERNRLMYILKSRGMAHSNQVREFLITSRGVRLVPAYIGPAGVLTGSARMSQEARDMAEKVAVEAEMNGRKFALEQRRKAIAAQIEALQEGLRAEEEACERVLMNHRLRLQQVEADRAAVARNRSGEKHNHKKKNR